jgi:hypothetical protein
MIIRGIACKIRFEIYFPIAIKIPSLFAIGTLQFQHINFMREAA